MIHPDNKLKPDEKVIGYFVGGPSEIDRLRAENDALRATQWHGTEPATKITVQHLPEEVVRLRAELAHTVTANRIMGETIGRLTRELAAAKVALADKERECEHLKDEIVTLAEYEDLRADNAALRKLCGRLGRALENGEGCADITTENSLIAEAKAAASGGGGGEMNELTPIICRACGKPAEPWRVYIDEDATCPECSKKYGDIEAMREIIRLRAALAEKERENERLKGEVAEYFQNPPCQAKWEYMIEQNAALRKLCGEAEQYLRHFMDLQSENQIRIRLKAASEMEEKD